MGIVKSTGAVSLSHDFVSNVRLLYNHALGDLVSEKVVRQGWNCYTSHAPPAYISAVAAIETFVNEVTITPSIEIAFSDSPLWDLDRGWVEELDIRTKLVLVPQLLFGKTFRRDRQPFQEINRLVKVRNAIVHYKMKYREPGYVPKYIKPLIERKIALIGEGYWWTHRVSTSEGIRWANNTIYAVANHLVTLIPEEKREGLAPLITNFTEIPKEIAVRKLEEAGIDPSSDSNSE